jgi:tetratricopeptide (TPR) repeat protein
MSSRRKSSAGRAQTAPSTGNLRLRLLPAPALALAFLVHIAALWFAFVDDDGVQIQSNPHIQSWQYLPRYFTADVWSQTGCGSNYYRPVFLLWLRLNHCLFDLNPMGWHLAAILLHVLVVWLVYLLAAQALSDKIAAGFAAAIFAVHPVNLESVAFVSGATETLEAVFFLGCMLCFLKGSRWPEAGKGNRGPEAAHRNLWRAAALLLFALALLTKETALILPLFLLIYELRSRGFKVSELGTWKVKRETFLLLSPYAVLLAVYLAVRSIALHGMAPGMKHATPATAIATWPAVLWFYLHKLAAPWPLSLDYGLGFTRRLGFYDFALPLVALLAVGTGLWMWFRRDRRIALAIAWLLVPLLPAVAGTLRFDNGQLVHDRYLYEPLIGFSMLCALALRRVPSSVVSTWKVKRETWNGLPGLPLTQALSLLLVLGILSGTTIADIGNWSSNMAVYTHALAVSPGNAYAHNSVGEQLFNHSQYDQAFVQFHKAVELDPRNTFARTTLAQAYGYFGNVPAEIAEMTVVADQVQSACAWANLADAQQSAGQLAAAETSWRRALALQPCPIHGHWSMAELLRQEGKLAEARAQYEAELSQPSDDPIPDLRDKIDELDRQLGSRSTR